MKRLYYIAFMAISILAAVAIAANTRLLSHTEVPLVLLRELHSGAARVGSVVPFAVKEDVRDRNGNVLVPKNTLAYAKVSESRREGALSAAILDRPARLSIQFEHTWDGSGRQIPLYSSKNGKTYTFTRQNTSVASQDAAVAAAWKDAQKRELLKRLIENFEGDKQQALTPEQQKLLADQGGAMGLPVTANLARRNLLSDLADFGNKIRSGVSLANLSGGPLTVTTMVQALGEIANISRASSGYIGDRFKGRNVAAPAGMVVYASVEEG